jgi:hypothetical protein
MSIPDKFAYLGGASSVPFQKENCENCDIKYSCKYRKIVARLEHLKEFGKTARGKTKYFLKNHTARLRGHIFRKQEVYLPVLIAAILLALVFVSKTAFSKTVDPTNPPASLRQPTADAALPEMQSLQAGLLTGKALRAGNLPVEDSYKLKLIGTDLKNRNGKICSDENKEYQKALAAKESGEGNNDLKEDVAEIVKNTPMAAMTDAISKKPRPVAAFIVGIAMKESKFGVYSPKLSGRDCFNYWGFKGGGKTVAGGYSCFESPEAAVDAVGGKIEKMVAKGVRTPAQAISWKCGSSCAGHGEANVKKWISDVAVNFYKINS